MMAAFDSKLLANGFKRYKTNPICEKYAIDGFEKLIYDKLGKKYYIHVTKYDIIFPDEGYRYLATVQFSLAAGTTFNVELLDCKRKEVSDIESFYEDIWMRLKCAYYEKIGE